MDLRTERIRFYHVFRNRSSDGRRLEKDYGDEILEFPKMSTDSLKSIGMTERTISELHSKDLLEKIARQLDRCVSCGIETVTYRDSRYPHLLSETPDRPLVLYIKGRMDLLQSGCISVVGTRNATAYGKAACSAVIRSMAESGTGPVIVSGMAEGIDSAAHISALKNGLDTMAVLGTGFDRIYPESNRTLFRRLCDECTVISEFGMETEFRTWNFLKRNRIIAGISGVTVVIESGIKGGAMNTASVASSYGRDVLAVPGRIGDSWSEGCNFLISNNTAQMLDSSETLYSVMGWQKSENGKECKKVNIPDGNKKKILLSLYDFSNLNANALSEKTGIPVKDLLRELSELEIDGWISKNVRNEYCMDRLALFD